MKTILQHKIDSIDDLKKLSAAQLVQLAEEIREYIISIVSVNPGHLGASLGTVEISIALHYVFNTPIDKLIWDVGHQAYAHKILTGRRDAFKDNRKPHGLSGFPKREESPFDAFGTGHASTSISALLGMAEAARLNGNNSRQHIAVIGDGSLSGGQAFEGLNNASVSKSNMLIIFNDNGISIDENVGGLKEAFIGRLFDGEKQNKKSIGGFVRKQIHSFKEYILKKSNFFESLQFRYFGPVDGHDMPSLVKHLNDLKEIRGPKVLHIITTKGKGLKLAEQYQTKYHSPGKFDPETGLIIESKDENLPPRYQDVFGETLLELAEQNEDIVAITPAMPTGSSLNLMMEKYPNRVFDVGIAEAHAVTFAAGLAADGKIPICCIYSTFMQRAYDQVIHDVALQKLPVIFCVDRAGLVGEDGPTHHGVFDLAYFNCIPNLVIASPLNEMELRDMMHTAIHHISGPIIIRYPRGRGRNTDWKSKPKSLEIGKGIQIESGKKIAVLSIGHVGNFVKDALDQLEDKEIASWFNMRFLKPLDEDLLHQVFKKYDHIITLEDGSIIGGLGSSINDFKNLHSYKSKIHKLGVPDEFVGHGPVAYLHEICGYDANGIKNKILEINKGA